MELKRRDLLRGGAAGALALLAPRGRARDAAFAATQPTVVATPSRTEGPYFVDEGLERSDITVDPSNGAMSAGFPLRLGITVSSLASGVVAPIAGAQVDLWHCDALGVYSDVAAQSTVGKKFLRGYQRTDAHGNVRFRTIYPGWYSGRTTHVHFKVRLFSGAQQTHELTSQFFFDDAVTDRIAALAPYASKGTADTHNADDGIYLQGGTGSLLLLRLADDGSHAVASFHVALEL
jgi:protocatechuate 3,4-dioxygenase beta subunit